MKRWHLIFLFVVIFSSTGSFGNVCKTASDEAKAPDYDALFLNAKREVIDVKSEFPIPWISGPKNNSILNFRFRRGQMGAPGLYTYLLQRHVAGELLSFMKKKKIGTLDIEITPVPEIDEKGWHIQFVPYLGRLVVQAWRQLRQSSAESMLGLEGTQPWRQSLEANEESIFDIEQKLTFGLFLFAFEKAASKFINYTLDDVYSLNGVYGGIEWERGNARNKYFTFIRNAGFAFNPFQGGSGPLSPWKLWENESIATLTSDEIYGRFDRLLFEMSSWYGWRGSTIPGLLSEYERLVRYPPPLIPPKPKVVELPRK